MAVYRSFTTLLALTILQHCGSIYDYDFKCSFTCCVLIYVYKIFNFSRRTPEEIKTKVDSYRQKLMGLGKSDLPKDEFGRIA